MVESGGGTVDGGGVMGGANLGMRIERRLVRVAERLGAQPGNVPVACGGWAKPRHIRLQREGGCRLGEAVLTPHWDCSIERMRSRWCCACRAAQD
ncbi:MAG: hypothetical protein R3F44_07300 [Candidatus Competibacteraceae bacterium]